jgi:hypothetical protein
MAIIKTIDKVHVARTATAGTDGKRTGKMCFGAGCEGGDFLVADRDPIDLFLLSNRFGEPVQGITNHPVNAFDIGSGEHLDHQFGNVGTHKLWVGEVSYSTTRKVNYFVLVILESNCEGTGDRSQEHFTGRGRVNI